MNRGLTTIAPQQIRVDLRPFSLSLLQSIFGFGLADPALAGYDFGPPLPPPEPPPLVLPPTVAVLLGADKF